MGQKLGYDRCPYLSFFVRRCKDESFASREKKRLKYRRPLFLTLKCYEWLCMLWMIWYDMIWYICMVMICYAGECLTGVHWGTTSGKHNSKIPKFTEEGIRLHWRMMQFNRGEWLLTTKNMRCLPAVYWLEPTT